MLTANVKSQFDTSGNKQHTTPIKMDPCQIRSSTATIRKALPFVKYDYYKDPRGEHYDDGSISLSEYLDVQDRLSALPIVYSGSGNVQGNVQSTPTLLDLPGETFTRCVKRVATEDGKIFTQSLLQNLWELEQIGECLGPFNEGNIRVRGHKCVLYNVERQDLDPVQLKVNYQSGKKILEDGFTKFGAIPEDIQHLFNLIDREHDKRSLFRLHASLWSLSIRGSMCMRMHEHLKTLPVQVRYNIHRAMGRLKYISKWRRDVTSNSLLSAIYTRKAGRYTNKNLQGPTAQENSEGTLYTDYQRHRVAHRMDNYDVRSPHTAQGSELAALVRWPLALPTLQYELHIRKGAGDLNDGELY